MAQTYVDTETSISGKTKTTTKTTYTCSEEGFAYTIIGEDIKADFTSVYFEDPLIATKFVFYVGDVRGGLGERT